MSRRRRNRDGGAALALAPEPGTATAHQEREAYMGRLRALQRERARWLPRWIALADYIEPGAVQVYPSDRYKDALDSPLVVNNAPLLGIRAMAAGMMSGFTNPSRPWLKLAIEDQDLARYLPVAEHLQACSSILLQAFARPTTRVYPSLAKMYKLMAGWGTACGVLDEAEPDDYDRDFQAFVYPIGSFYLANGPDNDVDAVYRRYAMTVAQIVDQFGIDQVSTAVRTQYEQRAYDQIHEVIRVIECNDLPDPAKIDWGGMDYRSVWFEYGSGADGSGRNYAGMLKRSGYREWPCMTPRWETSGEAAYGRGPGIQGQGDFDMLQLLERRKLQLMAKLVEPPMVGPASLRQSRSGLQPGEWLYLDTLGPGAQAIPAYQVNPQALPAIREEIAAVEARIKAITFYDLWLALSQDDRKQPITAREVAERHEEKLTQLGPVSDSVHGELLNPLVMRALAILGRRKKLPPPPEELRGQRIGIEYTSVIAQALKLVGIASQDRFAGFVGNLVGVFPEVKLKVNIFKLVEDYADALGIDPDVIVPQDQVEQKMQQQQQAAQQHNAVTEQIPAAAQAAKTLSQADLNGDNALNRLLEAQGAHAFLPQQQGSLQ